MKMAKRKRNKHRLNPYLATKLARVIVDMDAPARAWYQIASAFGMPCT